MNSTPKRRIRVLIVDDSALVRRILSTGISKDPELEVIGMASDPYAARDIMVKNRPDVITLDVEMPKMDGVTFLKHFMPVMPIPTIMISSLTQQGQRITLEALELGAVDFIPKPQVGVVDELPKLTDDINQRIKIAAQVNVEHLRRHTHQEVSVVTNLGNTTDRIIAIGSSTGGVEALTRILPAFPANSPGIVIVQHMPGGFTRSFADRLNDICPMQVKEAEDNDRVQAGRILVAPGGTKHTTVLRSGGQYRIALQDGNPVNYSRPSVDVMFNSVALAANVNVAAAVLTGMGKDGADGLLAIRNAGGRTVAQDENTSVVFGMPKAAWTTGGAESLAPLENIPAMLVNALQRRDN